MTRHPLHARCGYSQFNLSDEGLTSSRWRIASPKIGSPPHLIEFGDFGIAELFILNLKWLLKQRHHLEVLHKLIFYPQRTSAQTRTPGLDHV